MLIKKSLSHGHRGSLQPVLLLLCLHSEPGARGEGHLAAVSLSSLTAFPSLLASNFSSKMPCQPPHCYLPWSKIVLADLY